MREIKISLNYSKALSVLSGRPAGKKCYEDQIKNIVEEYLGDRSVKTVIQFPDSVKLVSGSYLLGLFEAINRKVGIDGISTTFCIKSKTNEDLLHSLINELKRSSC